jgi:peptidoglycan LD-endopeptidase CwlK
VVFESAIELIKRAYKEGINIRITDGYRSMEEQAEIYGQGRSGYYYKGKNYSAPNEQKVSNAEPGESNHNFGLAVDYVLFNAEGTRAIWTVNSDWRRVAAIAKELGFAWGGDWTSFKDYPHIEMMGGLRLADLRAGKRPNLVSKVEGKHTVDTSVKPDPEKDEKPKVTGNANIRKAQVYLTKMYGYKIDVDGFYGPETEKACIKALQSELNANYRAKLTVDGIYGPKTLNALPLLRSGAKNDIVLVAQVLLYSQGYNPNGIDGKFGSGMVSEVKEFQKDHKVSADGIIGENTWRKLLV